MQTKQCARCGNEFTRTTEGPERWERRRHCSRQCWAASLVGVERPEIRKRRTLQCAACGQPFEVGGRAPHRGNASFCSRRCAANARWRTGSRANPLTQVQAAYLAGLIDGEGSIMLYRRGDGSAMRLAITNTYRPVLEWCQATCGVGNIVDVKATHDAAKHKAQRIWLVNSQAAASVLEQIEPYLIIKKEQAQLAIEFQQKLKVPKEKADKEWQEQWRQRLRAMNARGPNAGG